MCPSGQSFIHFLNSLYLLNQLKALLYLQGFLSDQKVKFIVLANGRIG